MVWGGRGWWGCVSFRFVFIPCSYHTFANWCTVCLCLLAQPAWLPASLTRYLCSLRIITMNENWRTVWHDVRIYFCFEWKSHTNQKCLNGRIFFLLASCLHCWRSQRIFFPTANRCLFPHDAYNVSFFLLSLWQTGSLFIKSVFLCWQFSDSNTKNNNKKVCVRVYFCTYKYTYRGTFLVLIRFEQNAFLYIIQPSETNINCTLDIRIDDEKKTPLTGKKKMIVLILDTRIKNHLR